MLTAKMCLLWLLVLINVKLALMKGVLNGKHLIIFPLDLPVSLDLKRNSSGHIIAMDGIALRVTEWLSAGLNFTYEFVQTNFTIEVGTATRPPLTYLISGKVDILLGAIGMTSSRLQLIDLPFPLIGDPFGLLIPYPSTENNLIASLQPFSSEVWIGLLVSLMAMILAIYICSRLLRTFEIKWKPFVTLNYFNRPTITMKYVVAVILSQGEVCLTKLWRIRFLAGVWCLAAFVLVNAYSSVLISFLTAPYRSFLLRSVQDLYNQSQTSILVDRGLVVDLVLSGAETGVLKHLKDMLDNGPSLRCNASEKAKCIEKVQTGSYTYINGHSILMRIIDDDFKKHGTCRYTVAKETFMYTPATIGLPRKSTFTDEIRMMILKYYESGMKVYWERKYVPSPKPCLEKKSYKSNVRLSLKNLGGSFFVLLAGFTLALIAFIGELYVHYIHGRTGTNKAKDWNRTKVPQSVPN